MTTSCPKWDKCNSPVCPLDPDWERRVMLSEDSVCFYLAEAVKADAEAVFMRRGLGELFKVVSEHVQPMSSRWGRIRRALERAKGTGSRIARRAPWEIEHG